VGARHRHTAPAGGDLGQGLGPAEDGQAPPTTLGDLGVGLGDGRRDGQDLGLGDVGGVVADEDPHPTGGQALQGG